jgi:hypothetical protein
MTRLTRRQFLGTTAAGAMIAPRLGPLRFCPAEAALSFCAGATSFRHTTSGTTSGPRSGAKNNVKVTIDHIPHLNLASKIAAEIATSSATTSSSSRGPAPRSSPPR